MWRAPLLATLIGAGAAVLLLALPPKRPAAAADAAKAGDTMVSPADGATMVYVPAGEFCMGSKAGVGDPDEHPQRTVYLDAFYIDRTEVTNAQYGKYLAWIQKTNDHSRCPKHEPRDKDHTPQFWTDTHFSAPDQPVVGVDWYDACAYAAWAGKVLPTEAQWEEAARGTDGRTYPWGETWDPARCVCWVNHAPGVAVVGSKPDDASPYGCLDMAGNVREWCVDWYAEGYDAAQTRNPTGAAGPATRAPAGRVLRGGSWYGGIHDFGFRTTFRGVYEPEFRSNYVGFRCVAAPPAP